MPAVPSTARLFKSLPPPAGPWLASPLPFGSSRWAPADVMSCLPVAVLFFFLFPIVFFVIVSFFFRLSFVGRSPSTGSRRRSLRSNNLRNQITRTSRILHSCWRDELLAGSCYLLHIHRLLLLPVRVICGGCAARVTNKVTWLCVSDSSCLRVCSFSRLYHLVKLWASQINGTCKTRRYCSSIIFICLCMFQVESLRWFELCALSPRTCTVRSLIASTVARTNRRVSRTQLISYKIIGRWYLGSWLSLPYRKVTSWAHCYSCIGNPEPILAFD